MAEIELGDDIAARIQPQDLAGSVGAEAIGR